MTKIALPWTIIGLISLSAQDPAAVEKKLAEAKMQLEDKVKIMSASMINGPTVKGAPYSAQTVNETVQVLADGNRIANSGSSMIYRDSQGRERREEGAGKLIYITDPVESVSYTLEPNSKRARKASQHSVNIMTDGGEHVGVGVGVGIGRGGGGSSAVVVGDHVETRAFTMSTSGNGPETFVFSNQEVSSGKVTPKIEHLGTQTMEGVAAEGTRTTMTIPAGQIGNEQPIEIVSERWYSPELQVTVMTTRSDPRTGKTIHKLTNIIRSEPSPLLFQVPADFTVQDMTNGSRRLMIRTPDEQ